MAVASTEEENVAEVATAFTSTAVLNVGSILTTLDDFFVTISIFHSK